jgi:hypothetical protein
MERPEPRCGVQGILPDGLSVLAGKPKLGKSWWALNVALAVAHGGVALASIPVEAGEVLYLALEDSKRRLQERIKRILSRTNAQAPERLTLATAWPRQDQGGVDVLAGWLAGHSGARLVIIDTFPKFRPRRQPRRDAWEEDHEHAEELKALADNHGLAIVAVCHCRKMDAEDPLDSVSGTLGLTAAADAVLVLRRVRGQADADLYVTGRDLDEQELGLKWDKDYCLWSIAGQADELKQSKARQEAIDLLVKAGPLTPTDAAGRLGKPVGTVKWLFWQMAKCGQLTVENGRYSCANPANPPTANPDNRQGDAVNLFPEKPCGSDASTVGTVGRVGANGHSGPDPTPTAADEAGLRDIQERDW